MIKTYTIKYASKKLNFTFDIIIDELKVFFLVVMLNIKVKQCIGNQHLTLKIKQCQMQWPEIDLAK